MDFGIKIILICVIFANSAYSETINFESKLKEFIDDNKHLMNNEEFVVVPKNEFVNVKKVMRKLFHAVKVLTGDFTLCNEQNCSPMNTTASFKDLISLIKSSLTQKTFSISNSKLTPNGNENEMRDDTEDTSSEDSTTEDTTTEDISPEDTSDEDNSTEETTTEDTATEPTTTTTTTTVKPTPKKSTPKPKKDTKSKKSSSNRKKKNRRNAEGSNMQIEDQKSYEITTVQASTKTDAGENQPDENRGDETNAELQETATTEKIQDFNRSYISKEDKDMMKMSLRRKLEYKLNEDNKDTIGMRTAKRLKFSENSQTEDQVKSSKIQPPDSKKYTNGILKKKQDDFIFSKIKDLIQFSSSPLGNLFSNIFDKYDTLYKNISNIQQELDNDLVSDTDFNIIIKNFFLDKILEEYNIDKYYVIGMIDNMYSKLVPDNKFQLKRNRIKHGHSEKNRQKFNRNEQSMNTDELLKMKVNGKGTKNSVKDTKTIQADSMVVKNDYGKSHGINSAVTDAETKKNDIFGLLQRKIFNKKTHLNIKMSERRKHDRLILDDLLKLNKYQLIDGENKISKTLMRKWMSILRGLRQLQSKIDRSIDTKLGAEELYRVSLLYRAFHLILNAQKVLLEDDIDFKQKLMAVKRKVREMKKSLPGVNIRFPKHERYNSIGQEERSEKLMSIWKESKKRN